MFYNVHDSQELVVSFQYSLDSQISWQVLSGIKVYPDLHNVQLVALTWQVAQFEAASPYDFKSRYKKISYKNNIHDLQALALSSQYSPVAQIF